MELRIASATDRGRVREKNEDAVLTDEPLVAVADGMGGHKAGEVAAKLALDTLDSWKERLTGGEARQAGDVLREAFGEANRTVWEKGQSDESLVGMGTTLTAGWIDGGAVTVAHVGDSRAYLLRGDKLEQLTHDQNVAQDLVRRGRITPDEAASSPQRHIILQAVGADPDDLDIEIASVQLQPGDRLLLATDGLFGMVRSPERIRDILIENKGPDDACRALIDEANAAGGQDNISVVVIDAVGTADDQAGQPATAASPIHVERAPAPTEPRRAPRVPRLPLVVAAIALAAIVAAVMFISSVGNDMLLVAERDRMVVVVRGTPGGPGERATGDVVRVFESERIDKFPRTVRRDLEAGIPVESMSEARRVIENLPRLLGPQETPGPSPSPTPTPQATVTAAAAGALGRDRPSGRPSDQLIPV